MKYYIMLCNISLICIYSYPHRWNDLKTNFWKSKHIVSDKLDNIIVEFPKVFWDQFKNKFNNDDDIKEDDFAKYVNIKGFI